MKKLIVVLLFAATAFAEAPGGKLIVRIGPGFDVIVDGAPAGRTTEDEGGLILQLAEGPHHVVIRSAEGREAVVDVTIASGQTQDVTISPLGFRKKLAPANGPGGLEVECIPSDCTMTFKPPVDAVPPGRYPLVVTRGKIALRTDVDVPSNTTVTVQANFNARTIRVVQARPHSVHVDVVERGDPLTRLQIPETWRQAIRKTMFPGQTIESATLEQPNVVKVVTRIPQMAEGTTASGGSVDASVVKLEVPGPPRRDGGTWLIDMFFTFAQ